ncbi:alpha/beta hydrolase [Algoriphagus sediminis]|uniref:Alpha/beta hydrolase n=1 Tax=Algoriphagus sediminis TaxID=3057113 RepID=A0ABT7YFC6_9BACT|nr:alpha/beta hydrolase [Algoriphagus sediminis]MDN3205236.1 alpha/beta hydrolase [Algoriphagus sediminis]
MKYLLAIILFFSLWFVSNGQDTIFYKEIDTTKLYLEIYPSEIQQDSKNPAVVFFFGGGWIGGTRDHFRPHAEYFSKRGLTCFLVDYRIQRIHKTTPFESLMDAKSAMRYIRKNAEQFGIDPDKIIASGGSAGGHLAAATAIIKDFNDPLDDMLIDPVPNALVLFNPVIDNGPGGYGFERIGEEYLRFSPLHNIREGAPPTILFLGTEDNLIPVETVEYYKTVMENVGSRCDLQIYPEQGHGFFNYRNFDFYKQTILEADSFLQSLGFLNWSPVVKIE